MSKLPLFILGVNPRSGTNYLFHLLVTHPDCIPSMHNGEDYLIHESDLLMEYHRKVSKRWRSKWNNDPEKLRLALESGLLSYLEPDEHCKIYVSKTPLTRNLENFFRLFSRGYLIIILRSGQDVSESYIRTFNSRMDDAVRSWQRGASWIVNGIRSGIIGNDPRVMMIKYEDLYIDNEKVMKEILKFLGLDADTFDFEKSRNYDVVGSAVHRGDSKEVTWKPVPKDESFNPLSRSESWSRWKHYRFNWMAGEYSTILGYELKYKNKTPLYYLYNWFASAFDLCYRAVRWTYMRTIGK